MATAPAAAPGRRVEPARNTQLSRPGGAAPGALDPDLWTLPRDSSACKSLAYLSWSFPPAPAEAHIPVSEVTGLTLAASTFDLGSAPVIAALRGANLIEAGLKMAQCSAVLHELHEAGIFDRVYESEKDLLAAVDKSPLLDRTTLAGSHPLEIWHTIFR